MAGNICCYYHQVLLFCILVMGQVFWLDSSGLYVAGMTESDEHHNGKPAMVLMAHDDLERYKTIYPRWQERITQRKDYVLFNKSHLFTIQQRARNVLNLLEKSGFRPLSVHPILEIGCGQGGVLLEYLSFGADGSKLYGCDLLPERVLQARCSLPANLSLTIANGQYLPYASHSFDLVLQYTVFSSILAEEVKRSLAMDMLRVLRPDGMILWYDFWINPTNPHTRGIRLTEIRKLFPTCTVKAHKITLAPPLARSLVSVSWQLCLFLEKMNLFNTHYLVAITPE